MNWEVRIQYSNGNERTIRTYRNWEKAMQYVDALYSQGYPMHFAFVVCPVAEAQTLQVA